MATSRWYFHSYGRANTQDGDGTLSFVAPTMEPVDSLVAGGREVDSRVANLHYISPVFLEPLRIDGPADVDLYASSSAPGTVFAVALFDVHPDGQRRQVASGRGQLEAAHVGVSCAAVSHLFAVGHRLSVEVTAGAHDGLVANQIFHDAVRPSAVMVTISSSDATH